MRHDTNTNNLNTFENISANPNPNYPRPQAATVGQPWHLPPRDWNSGYQNGEIPYYNNSGGGYYNETNFYNTHHHERQYNPYPRPYYQYNDPRYHYPPRPTFNPPVVGATVFHPQLNPYNQQAPASLMDLSQTQRMRPNNDGSESSNAVRCKQEHQTTNLDQQFQAQQNQIRQLKERLSKFEAKTTSSSSKRQKTIHPKSVEPTPHKETKSLTGKTSVYDNSGGNIGSYIMNFVRTYMSNCRKHGKMTNTQGTHWLLVTMFKKSLKKSNAGIRSEAYIAVTNPGTSARGITSKLTKHGIKHDKLKIFPLEGSPKKAYIMFCIAVNKNLKPKLKPMLGTFLSVEEFDKVEERRINLDKGLKTCWTYLFPTKNQNTKNSQSYESKRRNQANTPRSKSQVDACSSTEFEEEVGSETNAQHIRASKVTLMAPRKNGLITPEIKQQIQNLKKKYSSKSHKSLYQYFEDKVTEAHDNYQRSKTTDSNVGKQNRALVHFCDTLYDVITKTKEIYLHVINSNNDYLENIHGVRTQAFCEVVFAMRDTLIPLYHQAVNDNTPFKVKVPLGMVDTFYHLQFNEIIKDNPGATLQLLLSVSCHISKDWGSTSTI